MSGRGTDVFDLFVFNIDKMNGEAGEYHTFVVDGPLFTQRVEILETDKVFRDGHWFLEISKCDLRAK